MTSFLALREEDGTPFSIREDIVRMIRPCQEHSDHETRFMVMFYDWLDDSDPKRDPFPVVQSKHVLWQEGLLVMAEAAPESHEHIHE